MKTTVTSIVIGIALTYTATAQLITGFGSSAPQAFNQTFSDFNTNTQTASSYQIIGNDLNLIFGDYTPVDISGNLMELSFTGTFTGTAAGNYQIELFDADGDSRIYVGNWGSFTQSVPTTVSLAFSSFSGVFSGTTVSLGLSTTGTGSGTINLTMDSLQAVPEPTTWVLLAGSFTALMVFRKRRKA